VDGDEQLSNRTPSPKAVRNMEKDLTDVARAVAAVAASSPINDEFEKGLDTHLRSPMPVVFVHLAPMVPSASGDITMSADDLRNACASSFPVSDDLDGQVLSMAQFLGSMRAYRRHVISIFDWHLEDRVQRGQLIL